MLEVLPKTVSLATWYLTSSGLYARTFENSEDGDMTKLSFVLDHEIKCCMLWSSNMLFQC